MKLRWLGVSCFEAEVSGVKVLMDPYLNARSSFNPPPVTINDFRELDLIAVTHGHFDHFSDAPSLLSLTDAVLLASREVCEYATAKLGISANKVLPLNIGETTLFKGVKITATKGEHLSPLMVMRWFIGDFSYQPSSRDELRKLYIELFPSEVLKFSSEVPVGPLQGYVFEEAKGLKLWNLSETMPIEEIKKYAAELSPQIVLVSVAGGFEREAAKMVEWIKPKVAVAHSFDRIFEKQALLGDVELFKELVSTTSGVEVLVPRPGEWYAF